MNVVCQGLKVRGQKQGLVVRGQGQGLVNWMAARQSEGPIVRRSVV